MGSIFVLNWEAFTYTRALYQKGIQVDYEKALVEWIWASSCRQSRLQESQHRLPTLCCFQTRFLCSKTTILMLFWRWSFPYQLLQRNFQARLPSGMMHSPLRMGGLVSIHTYLKEASMSNMTQSTLKHLAAVIRNSFSLLSICRIFSL